MRYVRSCQLPVVISARSQTAVPLQRQGRGLGYRRSSLIRERIFLFRFQSEYSKHDKSNRLMTKWKVFDRSYFRFA